MSEDDEDPFETLDVPEEREGDPFGSLDGDGETGPAPEPGVDDSTVDDVAGTGHADDDGDPAFEEEFIPEDAVTVESEGTDTPAGEGPLGGDGPFDGMERREGDPFEGGESPFEAVDVDTVDADEVWASLAEDADASAAELKRYSDVSKHRFCEQCEFFSRPPASHCTHEEAEILEYLDMETVRVVNCPVVAEQRQLENEE